MDQDKQLARLIYHRWMSNMKFTLDLEEYSYKDKGRSDPRFRFFKKQLMSDTYESLRTLFEDLEDIGILTPTENDEDVKSGYKDSDGGGSGYVNSKRFDAWLKREASAGNK